MSLYKTKETVNNERRVLSEYNEVYLHKICYSPEAHSARTCSVRLADNTCTSYNLAKGCMTPLLHYVTQIGSGRVL